MRIVFITIVPSPYQKDIFKALSVMPEVEIQVYYLEKAAWDSPWPEKALEKYESILPGTDINLRGTRFHFNWRIPDLTKADFVVLNGYMGLLFQWLLRFKSRKRKFIFWGERITDHQNGFKGFLKKKLSDAIDNCIAVAAIGMKAQREYQTRFNRIPIFNIPYHCSLNEFQALSLTKNNQSINLLFCGQMIKRKGLDILLKAFDFLSSRYNVVLHLVGREADLQLMLSEVSSAGRAKIINHGFQAPDSLPEYFALADIFVLPSRYDGWGVVVNQAIGAGLPVICSDQVGAGLDLIEDGVNGFLFKSEDEGDLRAKLMKLLDDQNLVKSMASRSRRRNLLISHQRLGQRNGF
ncbi:MAG: glycosyltransferase family 4 protein [Cyclobacteriaceae bacterium]